MNRYAVTLIIAGSDSCGGAGIQADVKTCASLGVYAATAITAVTAQNTLGVAGVMPVTPQMVAAQIDAVLADLTVDSIKIGMLYDAAIAHAVATTLVRYPHIPIVLDPVMVSTSGHRLMTEEAVAVVRDELFPLATLITPNIDEAEMLTGLHIANIGDMTRAARSLRAMQCSSVLVKGGHLQGEAASTDLLVGPDGYAERHEAPFCETRNTHGTGCTLSSAIAAHLALGYDLPEAVKQAKAYVTRAIEAGARVFAGKGHGALCHAFDPKPLVATRPLAEGE